MSDAMGPVSARLEEEVRAKVSRGGLVVWLDADGAYTGFVDRLIARRAAKELPYEVRAYRGSHLELMMALEDAAAGIEAPPLVIHMPGFNAETIQETPALELYLAGIAFQRALATLVRDAATGIAAPEAVAELASDPRLTLEHADRWVANQAAASEAGLRGELKIRRLTEVVDELLGRVGLARQVEREDARQAVEDHLEAAIGLGAGWRESMAPLGAGRGEGSIAAAERLGFLAASWALAVEYVDDLQREPVDGRLMAARRLPRAAVEACRGLAEHLRARHPEFYRRTAKETEEALAEEAAAARAEDLGKIDTFEFEEQRFFAAAVAALGTEAWEAARGWALGRLEGRSFWLDLPGSRRRGAWEVVLGAAELGLAIAAAGSLLAAASLEAAVKRYQARGAAVDLAHRGLEERWQRANDPRLPEREALREQVNGLRRRWAAWAEAWAREFSALCKSQGFLPAAGLRQRALFEEVVAPLCSAGGGTTVLFAVDALRYELAEALRRELEASGPGATVELRARLAELPTVTAVGMAALAPVSERGRLRPIVRDGEIVGLMHREFAVERPDHRRKAMHERVGGTDCPLYSLDEVLGREVASLRDGIKRARLVLVQVSDIDAAGEAGVGGMVFEGVLVKLRAAWNLLREAGARRFVFTADHGFLLLDDSVRSAQTHGRRIDPRRRHVLSTVAADHRDEVRVPLAELEYEGAEGLHLMMPEGTAVFDVGRRPLGFVHGGNSLQERVIPVLTVVHKHGGGAGGDALAYAITARAGEGVGEMQSLHARVQVVAQHALNFGGRQEVELGLRVVGEEEVEVVLVQARGQAKVRGASIVAGVDGDFELFFRLSGPREARVQVELFHPTAEVEVTPCAPAERFVVMAVRRRASAEAEATTSGGAEGAAAARTEGTAAPGTAVSATATPASATAAPASGRGWLDQFTDPGVRAVFEHLATHGAVGEELAQRHLGARGARSFARQFDELAKKAPFAVRIENNGGVKRYVRD